MYGKLTTDLEIETVFHCANLFVQRLITHCLSIIMLLKFRKPTKNKKGGGYFKALPNGFFSFVPLFEFNPIHCSVP